VQKYPQSLHVCRKFVRFDIGINNLGLFPQITSIGFPPSSFDRRKRRCAIADFRQQFLGIGGPFLVISNQPTDTILVRNVQR